ncbi:DUF2935 domain-containing protein [Clostridium sp. HBUAS56017]|uniref:DUF2935 domain-containing protein n=1 Tax=Clostridium sp. HBUAS56017 TaxID=2571128 RepID=UPI0011776F71|nr:DUF2935 domain-containing protein [Clostridium sp. HBUAS56017]
MINERKYVILSLELHLFFLRIMKEHALFMEVTFAPKNSKLVKEAAYHRVQFEKALNEVVKLSNGVVRERILESGEIVTDYTLSIEGKTEHYTGIPINRRITSEELRLECGMDSKIKSDLVRRVKQLNRRINKILDDLINFKVKVLEGVLSCNLFTMNYPSLIKHIIHEANYYKANLIEIENNNNMDYKDIKEGEVFWDEIMMEHALTLRGLLDPSEKALIDTANMFSENYNYLLDNAKNITESNILGITNENLNETLKLRDFKEVGLKGTEECKIQGIILPLLLDHVLREANHFIRLLKDYNKKINR